VIAQKERKRGGGGSWARVFGRVVYLTEYTRAMRVTTLDHLGINICQTIATKPTNIMHSFCGSVAEPLPTVAVYGRRRIWVYHSFMGYHYEYYYIRNG